MNANERFMLPQTPIEFSAVINGELIAASDRQPLVRSNPAHHVAVLRERYGVGLK